MANSQRRTGVVLAVALASVLGGCSSDDGATTADGVTTTTPEDRISTDAEVAAGLAEMQSSVDEIEAAGPDTLRAAAADDALEPVWQRIEGTIKKNEPDVYLEIEDSMSLLAAGVEGDEDKGTRGAEDMTAAIVRYLERHPG